MWCCLRYTHTVAAKVGFELVTTRKKTPVLNFNYRLVATASLYSMLISLNNHGDYYFWSSTMKNNPLEYRNRELSKRCWERMSFKTRTFIKKGISPSWQNSRYFCDRSYNHVLAIKRDKRCILHGKRAKVFLSKQSQNLRAFQHFPIHSLWDVCVQVMGE